MGAPQIQAKSWKNTLDYQLLKRTLSSGSVVLWSEKQGRNGRPPRPRPLSERGQGRGPAVPCTLCSHGPASLLMGGAVRLASGLFCMLCVFLSSLLSGNNDGDTRQAGSL